MNGYEIERDKDKIHVWADDQEYTRDMLKSLWDDHKILYTKGGILAVWVEEREGENPLIHLMGEDDGHIFWYREKDVLFDSYWISNYIYVLTELRERLKGGK